MKIIVPIDFSESAKNALRYASTLAAATESTIKLIHVVDPLVYNTIINDIIFEEVAEKKVSARLEFENILPIYKSQYPNVRYDFEIEEGDISKEIVKSSDSNDASLIIMGTHEAKGFKKLFFGTSASSVIEKSKRPVMSIPENYSFYQPKKIIFVSNYHSDDLIVIQYLVKIASAFVAEINVLHIVDDDEKKEANLEKIKQFLVTISEKISYSKISYKVLTSDKLSDGIESLVQTDGADMIAMSIHKKNSLEKLFNRNIAKELSFHLPVPLIVFNMDESD